ncbi:MAG: mitochondrial fission ELM1 family protein [Deltaproteobacteria bacterium]|nr:mitochondrial fission ELM1 family protein [Deltaproteobacteria bacterium]
MAPLKVVAYFDGRIGHEKQTNGVLNALLQRTPIDIEKRNVMPSLQSAIAHWARYLSAAAISDTKSGHAGHIDLIVGTGSRVHIPMLLLKKRHGGRAVTCMTPDVLLRNSMDLCFVPVHDQIREGGNIFITIGPPGISTDRGMHQHDRGLILIGGIDNKSHTWHSETVFSQVRTVIEKDSLKKWTITSSPRTPQEMCALLEQFASVKEGVEFFRSHETPRGWIEDAYDRNESVWVTADSISMVYEALSAGCRVGIFPMEWKKKEGKFHRSEQYLIEHNMVTQYEAWVSGKKELPPPKPLNEAARCAEEILKRWWPDRLK